MNRSDVTFMDFDNFCIKLIVDNQATTLRRQIFERVLYSENILKSLTSHDKNRRGKIMTKLVTYS